MINRTTKLSGLLALTALSQSSVNAIHNSPQRLPPIVGKPLHELVTKHRNVKTSKLLNGNVLYHYSVGDLRYMVVDVPPLGTFGKDDVFRVVRVVRNENGNQICVGGFFDKDLDGYSALIPKDIGKGDYDFGKGKKQVTLAQARAGLYR